MRPPPTWLLARPRCVLVLFCAALWLPGFFTLPPGDRDESRFAQATKQMNETGDYVRILNGTVPRNRKPIGIYWLQAPFALAAGPDLANPIWPYRVPSLLGGILAVLATFEAGLLLVQDRARAALAAAMLAACVALAAETHIAKTDAALLGATTLTMSVLARAWLGARVTWAQAALFWLSVAAGILLKGPITPMILGLATTTLCVWERRTGWLARLHAAWGVPLMLAAVLPWFVAIGVATRGRFFADSVGSDLAQKLAGGAEAHGAPPGLHLLLLPLLAFPSTLPVVAGFPAAWAARREAATRFLVAWAVPAWLVFEAVPTKLPHYTLPLYPAVFLLAARAIGTPVALWNRAIGGIGVVAAAGVLGGAAAAIPILLHAPWWLGMPGLAAACVAAQFAFRRRLAWALATAIPLYACLLQWELPHLPELWIAPRLVASLRQHWPAMNAQGCGLAVAGYAEPSLVFLAGTQTQLLPTGTEAARGLMDATVRLAVVSDREIGRFTIAAGRLGLSPRRLDTVSGFNASRGRWVALELFVK